MMKLSYFFLLCIISILTLTDSAFPDSGDKYVNSDDPCVGPCFHLMKSAYQANNLTALKEVCSEFHKLAGNGSVHVTSVHMDKKLMAFKADPTEPPTQVDVITYGVADMKGKRESLFYITEGVRADCVYYLVPTKFNSTLFHLTENICGISKSIFNYRY